MGDMPIVGRRKPPKNVLLERDYAKLGKNALLECRPAVVHFGGYELHQRHTQKIKIVNVSRESQNVHIINPTTPYFRASFQKTGLIAPGMSQEIEVIFQPNAWQYYYDCIRLHTPAENLLIPIHAYPVMNDVIFPRALDFGACPLSETTVRKVRLQCKVPIQFEFDFTLEKAHPDIEIFPVKGIIPANDSVEITIKYTPVTLTSASCELLVNISQFNFQPFTCKITANCVAGLIRERELKQEFGKHLDTYVPPQLPAHAANGVDPGDIEAYETDVFTKIRGNGSGAAADFGGTILNKRRLDKGAKNEWKAKVVKSYADTHDGAVPSKEEIRRIYGTFKEPTKHGRKFKIMEIKPPKRITPETESEIEGLRIPPKIGGVNALTYVLTQQQGKLKPKDLRVAIDQQRAQRAKQKQEQEDLRAKQGGAEAAPGTLTMESMLADLSGVSDNTTRQLKEMVFMQDLAEIDKAEVNREFQSQCDTLGMPPLTGDEVDFLQSTRDYHDYHAARHEREDTRMRFVEEAHGPYNSANPVRVTMRCGARPTSEPTYNPYKNDKWGMQKQVLHRFREAVMKVIIRGRADKRIRAIKARLASCKDRRDVKKLVELDAQEDHSGGSGAFIECPISVANVHRRGFPELVEKSVGGGSREPVAVETPKDFNDVGFFKLRFPHETATIGYSAHPTLVIPSYVPLELERTLRTGARQENGVRAPRSMELEVEQSVDNEAEEGTAEVAAEEAEKSDELSEWAELGEPEVAVKPKVTSMLMPAEWICPHATDPMSLLIPTRQVRVFMELKPRSEADIDWTLRPMPRKRYVLPNHGVIKQQKVGSGCIQATKWMPTLAERWQMQGEGRYSSVADNGAQLGLWEVSKLPGLTTMKVTEDAMSESESEDEGEDDVMIPTVDMCKGFFEKIVEKKAEASALEPEDEDAKPPPGKKKDADEDEDVVVQAVEPPPPPLSSFKRNHAMLSLEVDKKTAMDTSAQLLPERMGLISDKICSARHAWALEGHGTAMPCHKQQF